MATRGGFLVGDHNIRPRRPVRYVASKQTKSTKRKKKKPEWDVSTVTFTEMISNFLPRIQRFLIEIDFMKRPQTFLAFLTRQFTKLIWRLPYFFQSTVNDLNVHKATKEEQVIKARESVKRDSY